MHIYNSTVLAFKQRCKEMLAEEIVRAGFRIDKDGYIRGVGRNGYKLDVVVFEDNSKLGYYDSNYFEIGMNKRLIYTAKDSVVRDVIKHELAHFITYVYYGDTVDHHGKEFKGICERYGFTDEVALAYSSTSLEGLNDQKEGDLDSEKIVNKIKKLMEMQKSPNVHEAEVATVKANQLLLRHNLDNLKFEEDRTVYMDRVLVQKKKNAKMSAISAILRHFLVKPVNGNGIDNNGKKIKVLEVTGSRTNVVLAKYIAEFLDREMENMWKEAQEEEGLKGKQAKNSLFAGIAYGFGLKMSKSEEDSLSTEEQTALVAIKSTLDQDIKMVYKNLVSSYSNAQTDADAHAIGIEKGRNLTIRQGIEGKSTNLAIGYKG